VAYSTFKVDIGELLMKFRNGLFFADIVHILLGAEAIQITIVSKPLGVIKFAGCEGQIKI
jgi:hypothetical protein